VNRHGSFDVGSSECLKSIAQLSFALFIIKVAEVYVCMCVMALVGWVQWA